MDAAFFFDETSQYQQCRHGFRYDCGDCNAHDVHLKADDKQQIQNHIDDAGTQQENGDVASALQSAKKAVTDALGDDYWPDSEIPEEMLNETYGVSADLYDAYLGECPMISVNVDTLLIIHAKDGKVEDVENALNAYRDSLVNDTMQYPMNLGKIQASRVERIGDYVCFVQLGADTSSVEEQGDEAVITYCQEQNELALEAIRQTLE